MSEVQVTQGDKDAAKALYETLDRLEMEDVSDEAIAAAVIPTIALALAQAREAGYKAALAELTKSDTPIDVSPLRWVGGKRCAPESCVLDDQGRVLVLSGTLPVTKDGVVWLDRTKPLYVHSKSCGYYMHGNNTIPVAVRDYSGKVRDMRVDECYSSPQAAESAREVASD
jgi:hypothetical protein